MEGVNKVTKEMVENIIGLTHLQEGMLFHYFKNPNSDQYFEQLCLEVDSWVDIIAFKEAWNTVVQTDEMLRTVFRWKKIKKPVQMVKKNIR